jgi:membrane protein insertase Oxa1/YidC/SpoIIIJ
MLPVLIASILLLTTHGLLQGVPFLFIPDLSQPDRLLGGVNALPLLMFALTALDAFFRYRNDAGSLRKFMFVSIVLVVLVYNMAAGLVLYWIASNLISFGLTCFRPKFRP